MSDYDLADEAGQVRAYNELQGFNAGTGFAFPGTSQPKRRHDTVKIIIKQEADTTCAWIVGEDGETLPYSETNPTDGDGTAYLKSGQQVEIDVEIAAKATEDGQDNYPKATMSEVTEIPATGETAGPVPVDPDVDQKAGERPGEESQAGDDDTSILR